MVTVVASLCLPRPSFAKEGRGVRNSGERTRLGQSNDMGDTFAVGRLGARLNKLAK